MASGGVALDHGPVCVAVDGLDVEVLGGEPADEVVGDGVGPLPGYGRQAAV
ncbi:hypothetical protein ACWC5I_07480 [Kitasatospora sp. NPDC001574]